MGGGLGEGPEDPTRVARWVVYSDYGLNGAQVHGVYTAEPDAREVEAWATAHRLTSSTGYGGTFIEKFILNEPSMEVQGS